MPYLCRVKMHKSTACSPAEMTSRLRGRGAYAEMTLARSKEIPGNLDFAVTAHTKRDMDRAREYLESLGWIVGDVETA